MILYDLSLKSGPSSKLPAIISNGPFSANFEQITDKYLWCLIDDKSVQFYLH